MSAQTTLRRPRKDGTEVPTAPSPAANGRGSNGTVSPTRRYVFVGDRRSRRAIALGVGWQDGRLAARTLHAALAAIGLDPREQTYLNIHRDGEPCVVEPTAVARVRAWAEAGETIVGLGRAAQAALAQADVPHLRLIHPAARGTIRAHQAYQAHVAAVLGRRQGLR